MYSCDSGYSLEGQSRRQCLADGNWDGAPPSCRKIDVKPWIVCPDNIKQDLQPSKSTADVSSVWKEPTSNVKQITINPPEISSSYQFPAGETKVEWTATSPAGSASCAIYVTIEDVTPPTIHNCPKDIFETSDHPKAVTWVEPTFSDNVKVTKVDKSHNSGDTFQLLETNVLYEVMDAKLNRASCLFKVTLKRPPCHDPDGPLDGTKSCSNYGGVNFCQVQCPSGSEMYKATALYWQCNSGVWQPTETIPDCVVSVKKDPNTPCEEGRIEMTKVNFVGSELHCTKCPKGMYKSSAKDCSPCPVGTFNDQQGQTQCSQKCPPGTSSLPGAKSSVECKAPCPPGKYSATGLGPNCPDCPFDHYQDQAMKTSCIPCPNGTITVGKGAKSLAECGTKPKVTIDPLVSNIKEKESVSVNCYASGTPTPTYKWTDLIDIPDDFLGKMSQHILKNADGDVIGSRLTITDATYENTGSYECSVTNTHGSEKGLAKINVEKVIDFGGSGEQPS
ncbi:sushi, von Willebrand factor type A, EGF and pentraxin domain-containing protein 1-like [Orbicella faveolata]|uniref:sushi, von Willebrand factor type A, EGF and pentraxin domain-containing protein 1-like n=1 Tax=Orbicella faveolata TaxID=48498 RepID=UPI0009E30864|nr:sushi, von Willebrand factor type A, EGF and pentraxin domain-containing protein 1-like [Orbicella faveolata]